MRLNNEVENESTRVSRKILCYSLQYFTEFSILIEEKKKKTFFFS